MCAYSLSTGFRVFDRVDNLSAQRHAPLAMHYAQLFRKFRLEANMSVDALAEKADAHRNTIQKIERGESVRIDTIVNLMVQMGYRLESAETAAIAAEWLYAQCGVNLASAATKGKAQQKIVSYSRSSNLAATELAETIRKGRLKEMDIRMLDLVARTPELLSIMRAICDLLPDSDEDFPQLKVAEDK